jgi:glycosyltransferase involved in cell wall biosynthesis
MKAIQYMGTGIPAVVSPVGVNREIVEAGVSGEHARDEGDWIAALERLATDEPLRLRMGRAAYRRVTDNYSAEVHAPRVADILRAARR